MALIVLQQT